MPPKAKPLHEWYEIDEVTGCWNWTGFINPDGYGQLSLNRRGRVVVKRGHVLVYEAMVGPVPEGLRLDHLCRNKRCCNPAHLEPVTNAENTRRGLSAKLTKAIVADIRREYAAGGISQLALAKRHGVTERTIHSIVLGLSWVADLEEPPVLSLDNPIGRPTILTDEQIDELCRRRMAGEKNTALAREYGVSPATVTRLSKLFVSSLKGA